MEAGGGTGTWANIESAGTSPFLYLFTPQQIPIFGSNANIKRDAFTSSSDFIISPHAAASNLHIATCGSFHGYKFFPIIGKYVVQMLDGTLEEELKGRWAWDRERPDAKENPEWPRGEMNDLLDTKARL